MSGNEPWNIDDKFMKIVSDTELDKKFIEAIKLERASILKSIPKQYHWIYYIFDEVRTILSFTGNLSAKQFTEIFQKHSTRGNHEKP